MTHGIRLNKYIAQAGIASRRHADDLIARGEVRIDGRTVRELGRIVHPGERVEVHGRTIEPADSTYLVLHKPLNVVTTLRDPEGRRTVADIVPRTPRLFPVGRLDYATTGVLLLTNDGDLAQQLLHPRYGVEKTYRATISGRLLPASVRRLLEGLRVREFRAAAAKLRVVSARPDRSVVDVTIHEGRNRQIRRMFEALGHKVLSLTRIRFGPIALGELSVGHFRALTARERKALQSYRRLDDTASRSTRD